jgi:hypothetical protein
MQDIKFETIGKNVIIGLWIDKLTTWKYERIKNQ